jgi:glycine C-acetyltransferase/8-amino-7-oxononanoate synthase
VGYYQLHNHPEVIKAACDATREYGMGSATSRSYTGMTRLHYDVECKAADFFGTEDAAYLPSGYLSNVAGIQALRTLRLFDKIFIDETAHYCNMDGAYSVHAPTFVFRNNDPEDLLMQIKNNLKAGEKPLVATDGLFAVYGYPACLPALLHIVEQYDGVIWVDDAHPAGIMGENGRGAYEHFGLHSPRLFMGATLSKAFGGFGGIVPGTKVFVDAVRKGNVLKGASQPPAAAAAAGLKGMEILMANPQMRQQLWRNARRLKTGLNAIGIRVDENNFPMAAFTAGDAENMKRIHQELLKKDIFIQFSTYVGAGPAGTLRMVVFSTHSNEQIDYLIRSLKEVVSS